MEEIHERLGAELKALGLSAAQAARDAGFPDSQGLRDVLSGRKRLSAELLGSLTIRCGLDAVYVLTGERSRPMPPAAELPPRARALLDNYDAADDAGKRVIEGAANLAAQSTDGARRARG